MHSSFIGKHESWHPSTFQSKDANLLSMLDQGTLVFESKSAKDANNAMAMHKPYLGARISSFGFGK